jgi:hypothetical protein
MSEKRHNTSHLGAGSISTRNENTRKKPVETFAIEK